MGRINFFFETTNQLSIVTIVCYQHGATVSFTIFTSAHCVWCPTALRVAIQMFFFTRSKPATHSELATAQPAGLDPVLYSRSLLAISAIISPCSAKLFAGLKAHHIRSLVCTFSAHLRSRISQSSKRQNPSIPFSLSENHPFLG